MPSYADLASYRDRSGDEFMRWYGALRRCYTSIDGCIVRAAVDHTPELLVSKLHTYAALLGLGYGDSAVRAIVIAKKVELRLSS